MRALIWQTRTKLWNWRPSISGYGVYNLLENITFFLSVCASRRADLHSIWRQHGDGVLEYRLYWCQIVLTRSVLFKGNTHLVSWQTYTGSRDGGNPSGNEGVLETKNKMLICKSTCRSRVSPQSPSPNEYL